MRPGRRYCLWSLGIAEVLVLGLIAISATGSGLNDDFDPWVVTYYLCFWTLICVAGALIGWTVWAARGGVRRAQRLPFCRG